MKPTRNKDIHGRVTVDEKKKIFRALKKSKKKSITDLLLHLIDQARL